MGKNKPISNRDTWASEPCRDCVRMWLHSDLRLSVLTALQHVNAQLRGWNNTNLLLITAHTTLTVWAGLVLGVAGGEFSPRGPTPPLTRGPVRTRPWGSPGSAPHLGSQTHLQVPFCVVVTHAFTGPRDRAMGISGVAGYHNPQGLENTLQYMNIQSRLFNRWMPDWKSIFLMLNHPVSSLRLCSQPAWSTPWSPLWSTPWPHLNLLASY